MRVPASLPPGAYVLGFRWDCEESVRGVVMEGGARWVLVLLVVLVVLL